MAEGSKIKLLIFTPNLQCGGAEKFVSQLCNHIDSSRFSVCLAVLDNARPFYGIRNPAVEIVDLHESRVRYSLFKIKRMVRDYQPDILFSTANHLNLYFAIFRRWFPRQVKFLARESSIVSINSQRAKMPGLYNRLIRKYYRRFDCIICQSNYMQHDLVHNYKIPPAKTVVIHNAAESPAVQLSPAPAGPDKIYKFITVGRLSEEKGIERLIHSVGLLSVPFTFHIIGEGNKRNDLQQLINDLQLQDRVFLEGEKKEPFAGMEDADLFLMGSYYEGFPHALVEALALGIPAIAFRSPGGTREIISEGENGLLVDDNDLLGFAAAINSALNLGFERVKIKEKTQKHFSLGTLMQKLEELMIQL